VNRLPSTFRQLVEAAASVAGKADLADVLRTSVRTAMELTGAAYGALGVIGSHGMLSDFIFEGLNPESADRIGRLPVGKGVLGAIKGKALRIDDIATHPDAVGFPEHHPHMHSFLGVPVRLGGDIAGNLYLANKEVGAFTDEDAVLVEALAMIASSAISRARLEARLERAALVEDRERIARDIHDGVIQELFAVGLALQTARSQGSALAGERITQAITSIDDAMTRLRDYIFDLQSQTPDFEAQLRSIVSNTPAIDADIQFTGRFTDVDGPVTEHLVHFVREAVSNAVRHSGASAIMIRALIDDSALTVEVEDDGRGFDVDREYEGMGLVNMRARVNALGGVCVIDSEIGKGTTARGRVPR
jgi:signal transduction histidine kinase